MDAHTCSQCWLGSGMRAQRGGDAAPTIAQKILDLIDESDRLQDEAVARLESRLVEIMDGLGAAIRRDIGPVGDAAVVRHLRVVRASDILAIMDNLGLDEAHDAWFDAYGDVADLVAETAEAGGVDSAATLMDGEGFVAAMRNRLELSDGAFWDVTVDRVMPDCVWQGLQRVSRFDSLETAVAQAVDNGANTVAHAVTEARTDIAAFDRWTNAQIADVADPEGDVLLVGYVGPADGLTRPFCRDLLGLAFTREEFAAANNGQVGHPIDYGGGWNCRHRTVSVDRELLDGAGLRRGSSADIQRANADAGRGGKPGRR